MTQVGTSTYSSNRSDLKEIEYAPGVAGVANNQVYYTNTSGTTYNSFYQYRLKIVMTTSDTTTVPFVTSMRSLALPSGTGM